MITYDKLRIQARLFLLVGTHLGVPQEIDVPLASIRANFEENGIPFCVVSVATGRDVAKLLELEGVSPIHRYSKQLRLPARAQVKLKVTREDSSGGVDQTWPEGWFEVFDGWVADMSPSSSLGSSTVTLRLVHWLSDLDFSSPYSEDAFPNTPADFLFNAATVHGTGINRGIVGTTAVSKAASSFTAQSITKDFWDDDQGNGLRPFLTAIASERLMNWQQIKRFTGIPGPEGVRTNELMSRALKRFEPLFDQEADSNIYQYGVALPLRKDLLGSHWIAQRIRLQATLAAYSPTMLGSTVWDRLSATTAPQYMFSIIPMVDRALTVPYTPWLNRSWTTIFSNEFDVIDYSMQIRRPVKAVAIVGAYASWTNADAAKQAGGPSASTRKVLGYYEPPPTTRNAYAVRDGMTMYAEAPAWINDLLLQGISSFTAPKNARLPVAQNPTSRKPPPDPNFVGPPEPDQLEKSVLAAVQSGETLANVLAKATYLQEATKWRQAIVSTALRFDIAPGSSVVIHHSPDRMVEAVMAANGLTASDSMIGRVVRVSWSIDLSGNSPSAATVFHIAYLRSLDENQDDAFAAEDHPLWSTTWAGAPLVGMPEFEP